MKRLTGKNLLKNSAARIEHDELQKRTDVEALLQDSEN
jgi:hypothetical protein